MITDERTAAFIESFDAGQTPELDAIEKQAKESGVPIIRPAIRSLLKFVLASYRPQKILELGTATGFSALLMATYSSASIDTVENYEPRIIEAKKNFSMSAEKDRINLIEGDAEDRLKTFSGEGRIYDMIFVDAAKAQYITYLPMCKTLLCSGGILISDNVLFDGDIVRSRFAVRRRDRTIHARLRQYLRALSEDEELVTSILPVGDGITLSVKV